MLRNYKGITPEIGKNVYIDESAVVIGDVHIGAYSSVWCNVTIRGDVNYIRIGKKTSIQDNSVIHVTHDTHPTIVGNNVTIGHSVKLHGCVIEDFCLIGIGAVILDGATVGKNSIVGAGSVVAPNTVIPPGSMVMGVPARFKRGITKEERLHLRESAKNYVEYTKEYLKK